MLVALYEGQSYVSLLVVLVAGIAFLPLTRVAQGQLLESFESTFDDKVAVGWCDIFTMQV